MGAHVADDGPAHADGDVGERAGAPGSIEALAAGCTPADELDHETYAQLLTVLDGLS